MYCFLQNRTSERHLQLAQNTNGYSSPGLRYQDPSTAPMPMYTEGSGHESCPALTKPSSPGLDPAHSRTDDFFDEPRQVISTAPDCEQPNTSASLSRNMSPSRKQVSAKSGPKMVNVGLNAGATRESGLGMKRRLSRPMQVEVPSPSNFSDEAKLARTDKHGPANPGPPPGILNAAVARCVYFIEFVCIYCAYFSLFCKSETGSFGAKVRDYEPGDAIFYLLRVPWCVCIRGTRLNCCRIWTIRPLRFSLFLPWQICPYTDRGLINQLSYKFYTVA